MPFFNTPPGQSGTTPAFNNANPNSAVAKAVRGLSGDQASALMRLLQSRGNLTSLLRRKRQGAGGLFDDVGQGQGYQQTIGFGIEE